TAGADAVWRPRGTVLITGGTGAVGAHIARRFARDGAERLVLTGRRGPAAPGAAELESELTALGVEVTIAACDAADKDALAALVTAVEASGPIRTVVHAAGVPHRADLQGLTPDEVETVLAGKVTGAENLDAVLDHELDAFVLMSSAAGVWGGSGQGAYAAANAMLDALAARRRSRGLRAVSLAWGSWAGEGMAAGETGSRFQRLGLNLMRPEDALALMYQALAEDQTFLTVADVDWDRFSPTYTVNRPSPLIGDLPEVRRALTAPVAEPATGLAAVPAADRRRTVREIVREAMAAVLGGTGEVGRRTFKELGFDSMTAVDIRGRLSTATGIKLPSSLIFDHPTPDALVTHLLERIYGAAPAATPVAVRPADEPIAIVAMSCRYPGGVESPEDLWNLVAAGVDAIGEFPADRGWDLGRLYHPDPEHPGTTYTRQGGFLGGATEFDAGFFRISPREATAMDPQQRIVLETSWEAFERAGLDPVSLRGSQTGVFIGASSQEYGPRLHEAPAQMEGHFLTGGHNAVISGRVAYELGLEGPALTVDTACSSSLVALHLAVQSLRQGECALALAGGVAVLSSPGVFVEFSRQRGLAADGRCRSFSASASGTGWSEGAGILVLERLSDARRNGHPVLAIVRGSAVNQDGASNGLAAPNGPSQQRVIRAALAEAGLSPADVDAVEAHGTGTTLGDPIEAEALLATYGQDRERPLYLGSLKSNLGHAQAAAGVGGIIKMVEAMRYGTLPKTLHVDEPTPHVDWSAGAVSLLTEQISWPEADRPRRAGVSAFGISGTNAHVILEQVPDVAEDEPAAPPVHGPVLVPLSARGQDGLRAQAARLRDFVAADPALSIPSLARSLGTGRSGLPERAAVLAEDREALLRGLEALSRGEHAPEIVRGTAATGGLAMVFTGQGAQLVGMGRELAETFPAYAAAFDAVVAELDAHLDRPLHTVIAQDLAALDQTGYTQPALFAFEVALFRLLESWGLRPDVLVGHSIGELAAAHVAGILSLADAATLVAARGRLMQRLPAGGMMVAVQAGPDAVLPLLRQGVDIAAVNGPEAVTISGDEDAVAAVAADLAARSIKSRRVRASHAFHSHRMDAMLAEFRQVAEGLDFRPPELPIVSTLTGAPASAAELCSPDYWVRQVREPVRFHDAVRSLAADGVTAFLELGPDTVLSSMIEAAEPDLPNSEAQTGRIAVSSCRRDRPEARTLLTALATLHTHGVSPDWTALYPPAGRIDLPTYAFRRQRYWLDGDQGLVRAVTRLADTGGVVLTGSLSAATRPWLADHQVMGTVLLPGTAFVELAVRAADEVGCTLVTELTLETPLAFRGEATAEIQVSVGGADASGGRTFTIHSRFGADAPWFRHATGTLGTARPETPEPMAWPPADATPIDPDDVRAMLVERGYDYGPAFGGLRAAWRRGEEWFAEVALPDGVSADGFVLHPALLDTALQPLVLGHAGSARLPFSWQRVAVHATGATVLRARLVTSGDGFSVRLTDGNGNLVLTAESVIMRPVPDALDAPVRLFTVQHVAAEPPAVAAPVTGVRLEDLGDVLGEIQRWTAEPAADRLVIVTRNAGHDPEHAAVTGLVRSAQTEHPGRFVLVDTDTGVLAPDDETRILAMDEPEVVIREGGILVPRLTPSAGGAPVWSPDDCVLITGGTGTLGGLVARHLVVAHGVRRLVLTGRRGETPPGVADLDADIAVVACDVTDRDAVARLLRAYPVTAVVHAAGVLDDGVIESLTPERMEKVLAPKVTGARILDELTRDRELSAFVLFSSAAGVFGTAGQGNYAAANAALDAIARARHAEGLPATSLAWGMWAETSAMTGALTAADRSRLARSGLARLSTADALAMLDAGAGGSSAAYVAAGLDTAALRTGEIPPLLRALVRGPARRTLPWRTASAPLPRSEGVLDAVRQAVAEVLGHQDGRSVDAGRAFQDLGFDSLTAVELRNRINAEFGLKLPATLVFDHPTAAALADHLRAELFGDTVALPERRAPQGTADDDPIVIIGMSCRYPGEVGSPEDLWRLVTDGVDATGEFPADRGWDLANLFDDDPASHGHSYTRRGGFLHDAALFDAEFFGISPREAAAMDPQQRLLLETSWELLERAGIDPVSLRGSQTGVFAGVMAADYASRLRHVPKDVEGYLGNGSTGSLASGRIAYTFGLEGPALTVDTACSSSLVA
ncbi:MAG: SDR family NAD(P)-dependent oxidoreductase, partial [Nonomuraea sp.]|nr:SDR family NAD(P)-dependent oxidoreductase [Nonomuraea sp.]